MKKFLLIAVAAFGMLMTACSKDEVAQPVGGEESVVTFTVEAPVMATRAHGDGYSATELNWAVYDRNADEGSEPLFTDSKNFDQDQLTTTVKIPFVNGMTYDVLFWAEAPGTESPYAVDWAAKTVGYADATKLVSNSEDYDAFYYFLTGDELPEITGPVTKTVELKRPFAQLNIKTNDADKAEQSDVVVKNVKVVVKNGYSSFDLAAGEGETNGEVAFGFAPKQGDETLAVNYLFTGGEKSLVDVVFSYTDEYEKVSAEGRTMEFAAVPVQRNYRTNIVGSLLTSEGKFNIETKPGFETTEHNVEVVTVASATELVDEITNGDADQIILTGDINLNDLLGRAADNESLIIPADRTVTLNLGGFTLSHAKTQTGAFNMIQNMGTLTIENGTVSYADNGNGGNYVSNTIQNSGVLTLKDVTVVNNSSNEVATNGYPHPVDNSGKLIVEEGTVLTNNTNYSSMRIWCTEDTDTEVIINGGTFNGSIDFQTVSAKPNKGTLTINGGTFNADTYTKSAVRLLGFGTDVDEMVATINGGTFNGLIKRGKYVDGEFNSQVFFVKGGTFNDASVFEFLADGAEIELGADIETSKTITIGTGKEITLDLNGKTLSAVSTQTGTNYNMIDVRGTLTVANGTITTKHEGQNMAWNNSTNVFNVTAGGVLNLESVVAKNLGGSDMAFVAHLNNWGEVTLNVNNSTLESPYVAVRVFNSGYDMNNVTIKNSTLKAKNCVWVHNYTAADFGTQDKADAQKALLNFDILNGTNTFEYTAAAVRLGMTNSTYLIDNAVGLKYVAEQVNSGASYYKGSTIKLIADIDLNNEEWTPIGSFAQEHGFMGNFDGNGKVIKNLKISNISLDADNYAYAGLFGITEGVDANNENYIKNLVIENVNISTEGHIAAAAIAYPYYTNIENVLVKGNVTIKSGNYTSGVLAYTRRCVNAKDIAIAANEGSSIEGDQAIGGVISDIQMNGGLKANYSNFAASGLTIKGNKCVGGISGIICLQTLNGATVKNVTIVCDDARRGIIAGADGGDGIITNPSYENVTGADTLVGASY